MLAYVTVNLCSGGVDASGASVAGKAERYTVTQQRGFLEHKKKQTGLFKGPRTSSWLTLVEQELSYRSVPVLEK